MRKADWSALSNSPSCETRVRSFVLSTTLTETIYLVFCRPKQSEIEVFFFVCAQPQPQLSRPVSEPRQTLGVSAACSTSLADAKR